MYRSLPAIALCLGLTTAWVPAATDSSAVMAPVNQFVDGINKNDTQMTVSACDSYTIIIDDFPPHVWHGATACSDWNTAYHAINQQYKITGTVATLHAPLHVNVTGDRAYVVVPASLTYVMAGKRINETAIWTLALRKSAAGWRITGWAWGKR